MGGKIGRFAEYFPLYGVERGCLIGKRGDITACYSVGLPELFTLGADGYGALHSAWCRALRLLPPWTVVHKQDWFTPARVPPPCGEDAGRSCRGATGCTSRSGPTSRTGATCT